VELEPDQEKQEDDPEIGDVEHFLGRSDQPQPERADQCAGDQITEHGAEP
jgi:hypothetical protein